MKKAHLQFPIHHIKDEVMVKLSLPTQYSWYIIARRGNGSPVGGSDKFVFAQKLGQRHSNSITRRRNGSSVSQNVPSVECTSYCLSACFIWLAARWHPGRLGAIYYICWSSINPSRWYPAPAATRYYCPSHSHIHAVLDRL